MDRVSETVATGRTDRAGPMPGCQTPPHAAGATLRNGLGAANADGAGTDTPPGQKSAWRASKSFAEFRAACDCFGLAEVARSLGYRHSAQVLRTYHGQHAGDEAVRARWEAAKSVGRLRAVPPVVRRVGPEGVFFNGRLLSSPYFKQLVGEWVVLRPTPQGELILHQGPQLRPLCVLRESEAA